MPEHAALEHSVAVWNEGHPVVRDVRREPIRDSGRLRGRRRGIRCRVLAALKICLVLEEAIDRPSRRAFRHVLDCPGEICEFVAEQDDVFERSCELAHRFGTDRVRCFDFWRLEDQAPYREAMNQKLREAADKAGKKGIILVLENEGACNTATAAESAKVLAAVKSRNFMLNWDPGNAATHDEVPYPDGYNLLPKDRIGHCHCKDAVKNAQGKWVWAAMGKGKIDWVGQFKALKRDGYKYAVSLETHWRGAGTPEESTRQSWAGMKQELQQVGALNA